MTLQLDLPPALERRLSESAARQGVPVDQYALRVLEQHTPGESPDSPAARAARLRAIFESWLNEPGDEQRETGEYLIRALDENRVGQRKLFPPEMKGKTW